MIDDKMQKRTFKLKNMFYHYNASIPLFNSSKSSAEKSS